MCGVWHLYIRIRKKKSEKSSVIESHISSPRQLPDNSNVNTNNVKNNSNNKINNFLKTAQMEKIYYEDYSLEIKVLSTWGKNSVAGLTELQMFDCEGNLIQIKPSLIYLRNCGSAAHKKVGNLVNGKFHTNKEDDMWIFLLPSAPETAEICVNFKSAYGLGAIRIWNYNIESKNDNNKGIKDINLYLNKSLIFNGTIFPGKGKIDEDYCTTIFLTRNSKMLVSVNKL